MPACYMITTMRITDPRRFDDYMTAAVPTMDGHEFEILVNDLAPELLEGERTGTRMIVTKWPSKEAARAWLHSPAYEAIVRLRHESATTNMVLADGLQ